MSPSGAATDDPIAQALALLRGGELVAIPTETVYGLGADALNPTAVRKIYAVKGRPSDHPLIVHLARIEQLGFWARQIPREAIALAHAFWPGPLTLILKRSDDVPDILTGGQDTIGLRIPKHPVALELLRRFDSGIAAPSANRYQHISPTTAAHVRDELGSSVSLILDGGACDVGIESTILDLSSDTPTILRPGLIGAEAIGAVIGRMPQTPLAARNAPRAPGSHAAHYAPRTPLHLATPAQLTQVLGDPDNAVLALHAAPGDFKGRAWIEASDRAAQYAHDLYANLRALDALGARVILLESPPQEVAWEAINDRIRRAVTGSGKRQAEDTI